MGLLGGGCRQIRKESPDEWCTSAGRYPKGAFVLTSDGARKDWDVSGPHFPGWETYHVAGSPADPNRLYAAPSGGWFGQVIQRSDDGGLTWEPQGNKFAYEGEVGPHKWYDGTPRPWDFTRVWHLEPSLTDPDTVYAGVEDAALFRSVDGAQTWQELPGLRTHHTSEKWEPGAAACACTRSSSIRATPPECTPRSPRPARSAATTPAQPGGRSTAACSPRESRSGTPRSVIASTTSRCTPPGPRCLFMQKHWDVMRSDNAGESWQEISGNLPTDFGFPIAIHAHEPDTIYVVPITSDSHHFVMDGKLRVYRSRTGGNEWEGAHRWPAAKQLLRQRAARRDGGRLPRRVRDLLRHQRRAGVRISGRRRQLGTHRS